MQNSSMFVQDLARRKKEKCYGFKCKGVSGKNLNPRKLYLIFGLEKP